MKVQRLQPETIKPKTALQVMIKILKKDRFEWSIQTLLALTSTIKVSDTFCQGLLYDALRVPSEGRYK